ncbi:MAG: hypothetical protein HY778_13750 [Betaproteobacteria bacterium]|nr:hypothetical protein [Betaproteobacteria bacterium]
MTKTSLFLSFAAAALLAGCATLPSGPSVMVLPGTGKSFEQFQTDDGACRQFAFAQIGVTPGQAATDSGVRSAAVGTVVGAVAGAAIGGRGGAGVGAGTGLVVGSMAGAGAAEQSAWGSQRRFDHAYIQCMYAKGHRVPVSGRLMGQSTAAAPTPPPPPAGTPPLPPPGAAPR